MDLMTLVAKLSLDDKSFRSGVESAESAGQRLAGKMSAMTVAVGNLMADLARKGFDAVKSITTGAVDAFADYEQLVGGIETLFKTSSDKMMKYAKESYRTTGLSANQYMETVTSFSASLLQGLGGDTEQAAEIADMAVQDMADNANKLGTDISSIQTAYQGFAKQNYTMLDNLKLGYGGTKEEMVRLINDSGILNKEIKNLDGITFDQMIEAIHKIQEEMGITGTTAKEASETISGSKASLVAAWNDLMMTVAGADMMDLDTAIATFQTTFSAYMSNFLPSLMITLANSGTLVEGIAGALESLPNNLLSMILSAALEGGTGVIEGIDTVVNWLIDQITESLQGSAIDTTRVAAFAGALGTFVGHTVKNVVTKLPTILEDLASIGVTMAGEIIKGIWDGLFGSEADNELQKIEEKFNSTLIDAEVQSSRAQAILNTMDELSQKYGTAAKDTQEWKNREDELEKILGGSKKTFEDYGDNIEGAITHLKNMAQQLRALAIQQAMDERLKAEYGLLGELELNKIEAQGQIEDQQSYMNVIEQKVQGMTQGYVDELTNLLTQDSVRNKLGENNYVAYLNAVEEAQDTINGSNGIVDLARLISSGEFSNLTNALKNTYNLLNTPEEERIWTRGGYTDEDLSPEVIEKMVAEYEVASTKLADANKAYDDATEEIKKVKDKIESTERAVEMIADEISKSSTKVETSGNMLADAILAIAGKIGNIKIPQIEKPAFNTRSGYSDWTSPTEALKAVGMDYVPYDGFRAILHKGEAIITRDKNEKRAGYDAAYLENALEAAIERSMTRMNISMNGEKVADLTTDRVNRNISGSDHARKRAMGG